MIDCYTSDTSKVEKFQLSFSRRGSPQMATKSELQVVKLTHSVKHFDENGFGSQEICRKKKTSQRAPRC